MNAEQLMQELAATHKSLAQAYEDLTFYRRWYLAAAKERDELKAKY